MTALRLFHPTEGQQVIGQEDGDIVSGGPTADLLSGHVGADIFTFSKGDGADLVFGFERGVDTLHINGSIRQTSLRDTTQGVEVYYGAFGQEGADHFVVVGIHSLALSDFAFA